jgi:hypothetical protein
MKMKTFFSIYLLFNSFIATAQIKTIAQNDAVEDTSAQPAVTETGKPNGKISEMKMSKDGGILVSEDGTLELIIPSGALSKKTNISIQPVTNMMPNGNGQAFRLELSGIQFQKPVQLIFHYTDEESADSAQLLMGIAMQDDSGQWYGLKNFTLDTVAKTISGNINHFSDWSKFDVLKLNPAKARVKVNKSIVLVFSGMEPFPKKTDGPDLTFLNRTARKVTWSVNNMIQGNSVVGTLRFGTADYFKPFNTYYAPSSVPEQNPVTVSVKLENVKYDGINYKDIRLKSKILIYNNAYEVSMITSINSTAGSELGNVVYKDTGSFVVSLQKGEAKMIEKINKNTSSELDYKGKCTITVLKPGPGNINIKGIKSIQLIPSKIFGAPPTVDIAFAFSPSIYPTLKFSCPPPPRSKGATIVMTNASMNAMLSRTPAYPQNIKFVAKEAEQTLYKVGEEGGELFIKITVKKLEEDY